jgi:hypothetical protein
MKKTISVLTLFIILTNLTAQTWAPVGAKWTYSFSSWTFPFTNSPRTIECVGDTVIQSKSCRIIQGYLVCSFVSDTSYLYYENDKIFMYIDSVVGFHTLYDFTASAGNSWTIIAPGHQVGDTSVIVVDSIGTKIFSGDTFSVQYVHNLNEYDRWVFPGAIIKDIGNSWCFFPLYSTCDPWTGPIRCYEDSTGTIVFSSITCDTILYYSVKENSLNDQMEIYPNPATNELIIETNNQNINEFSIDIFSSTGQRQISITGIINNTVIDIDKLAQGLYFIKFTGVNGQTASKKFIKE